MGRRQHKTTSERTAAIQDDTTATSQSGGHRLLHMRKLRLHVITVLTAAKTSPSRWASAPDSWRKSLSTAPETTRYNRHCYECNTCGTQTVASHPDCPSSGQSG